MAQPFVAAICLTRDRPEMLKRAVRSFQTQTYPDKILVVWNNGAGDDEVSKVTLPDCRIWHVDAPHKTTGEMRNDANAFAFNGPTPSPDIVVHWDDDDWSHPNRVAEQVALLQASGKDCVGYRDMLFWRSGCLRTRSQHGRIVTVDNREIDEAWLYANADTRYAVGTSLCYWRKTWERNKFKHVASREDSYFVRGCETLGVTSLGCMKEAGGCDCGRANTLPNCPRCGLKYDPMRPVPVHEPRMIASIHGGNTGGGYVFPLDPIRWYRVPQWDECCREIMEAK